MTARPDPEPGQLLAGRYHLRHVLGRGGAGTVWRADDEVLDRPVAVKLLHPELERDTSAVERFRREATAAAALTHPNAVIVYDIGEDAGRVFLVMELVDGVTLAELLEGDGMAADDVTSLGVAVARALGAAHDRGLVHRDVKPGNILITREGIAKVTDFGIATALGDAQARLTTPGMVVGSSAYLAPEQLEGAPLDGRADVYALGLVLHECCTGRPTFSGGTAVEVATRRLAGDVPPPGRTVTGVPEELDLTIERATRRDPGRRFTDGGDLAAAIAPLVPLDAPARLARLVHAHLAATTGQRTAVEDGAPPADVDTDRHAARSRPVPGAVTGAAAAGHDEAATRAVPRVAAGTATAEPHTATLPVSDPGTSTPTGAPAEPAVPPPRRSPWGRPWAWMGVVVFLVLLGFAIADVIRGDDGQGDGSDGAGGGQEPIAVADADAYDPLGTSPEHPEDVPLALDDDPDTAWQTQRYNSADFGGLKDGAGLWLDLGEPTALGEVVLGTRPEGAALTLYAGDEPPPSGVAAPWTPQEWGTAVAEVASAGAREQIDVGDVEARYLLVWFTSLPADGSGYRVHVGDLSVTR